MRWSGMRVSAVVLVALLCLVGATPASMVAGAGAQEPDVSAQDGEESDPSVTLRLVNRESSSRADAVVIGLFAIAGGMTILLAIFLWHTSPRRRLRLARQRSKERLAAASDSGAGESEPAASDPIAGESEAAASDPTAGESEAAVSDSIAGESEAAASDPIAGESEAAASDPVPGESEAAASDPIAGEPDPVAADPVTDEPESDADREADGRAV